jgi:hypothetical protein
MRRWTVKSLAVVLGVALILGGVIFLGRWTLERLRERDRHPFSFVDISCEPPPGLSHADFLDEVQYLGSFPASLHLREPELAQRLARGFALHPWVAKVEKVEVVPPGEVRVRLRYRRPALAVPVAGQLRIVDSQGVLLPRGASGVGVPVYKGKASPPAGPAGTPWGDAAVENAARLAATRNSGG